MSATHRPPIGWRNTATLTPTEAAAVTGISRSRFYELVAAGRVPMVRDPQHRQRVRVPDLLAFMAAEGITPADEQEQQPTLFGDLAPGTPLPADPLNGWGS